MSTVTLIAPNTAASIDQQIQKQRLPASYRQLVNDYLLPVSKKIDRAAQSKPGVLVVGINGGQGSGKSTMCIFLQLLMAQLFNRRCAILSIDDFYFSKKDRQNLAQQQHHLLATRGVPGTHDMALALDTLTALIDQRVTPLPKFDKATDDALEKTQWPVQQPIDIVLLEGWCIGATAETEAALINPVNQLEAEEDSDRCWRTYVNKQLATVYQPVFSMLDMLIMLKVPSMDAVYQWRQLQEQRLAEKTNGIGTGIMNADQVRHFIAHYERLTRHMLNEMPARADVIFHLSANHSINSVSGLASLGNDDE